LGILGIENRKPNIFFLSFPAANNQIYFILIFFPASVQTQQLVHAGRATGYRGRARARR
jgi:hypothetical protein